MQLPWQLTFDCLFIALLSAAVKGDIIIYDGEFEVEKFSDIELPFGRAVTKNGIEGAIISANPPHACSDISKPPEVNTSLSWFVLIAGNMCSYHTKVVYSQNAGFSAAIIYSLKEKNGSSHQHHWMHKYLYANISAVLIETISGLILKKKYLFTTDKRFWVLLRSNHLQSIGEFSIGKYRLLYITAAFIIIFLLIPVGIVKFVHQVQNSYDHRLSSQLVHRLRSTKFERGSMYETCAICLEDYEEKDDLRILPCLHGYHVQCIDPWLMHNKCVCPVCKQNIVVNNISMIGNAVGNESTPLLNNETRRILPNYTLSENNRTPELYHAHNLPSSSTA